MNAWRQCCCAYEVPRWFGAETESCHSPPSRYRSRCLNDRIAVTRSESLDLETAIPIASRSPVEFDPYSSLPSMLSTFAGRTVDQKSAVSTARSQYFAPIVLGFRKIRG